MKWMFVGTYPKGVELWAFECGEVAAGGDALVERVHVGPAGGLALDVVQVDAVQLLLDPGRQHGVLLAERGLGPEHAEVAAPARGAVRAEAAAVVEHAEALAAARERALPVHCFVFLFISFVDLLFYFIF